MAKYNIVEQVEKHQGEEVPVKCKHVRGFMMEKQGGGMAFALFKFMCLKIVLRHHQCPEDGSKDHYITWTNKSSPTGKFIYHWAPKMEHPKFTTGKGKRKRTHFDTLSPMVKVPGETQEWESATSFAAWLTERCGPETSAEIMTLFADKLVEVGLKQQQAAENKAKGGKRRKSKAEVEAIKATSVETTESGLQVEITINTACLEKAAA